MRHRMGIGNCIGLGNPCPAILRNNRIDWIRKNKIDNVIKDMINDAVKTFPLFRKFEGADFDIENDCISIGIEPAYMYEHLDIIKVKKEKKCSHRILGYAHGAYGSGIAKTYKFYSDYKYKSKFVKFIDKWHDKLFS